MAGLRTNDAVVAKGADGILYSATFTAEIGSPNFPASNMTPVASTALVVNTLSPTASPEAGRGAQAWLSGSGSASGYFAYSKDGTNWFQMFVEGTQIAVWSYAKPANAGSQTIAGIVIPFPTIEKTGFLVALVPTSVSGTVNVEITQ